MEAQFRRMQRATVARSALDVIALVFLACGFAFWGVAFWQLLGPPALLSLLSIQAVVLALVYALAAPLLWSALVPSTPAGQLLQKTQWRTFGFAAIVGAAFYLTYQAERMIELWLWSQPGIQEAGFERSLAISLSIGFILIPALAWTQLTPERWLAAIQQAHAVKKLELQQRGELAIIKAKLLRAERLALKGWANLLPLEQAEAFNTMRGLLMASSDTQRDIVRTLDMSSELERDIIGDVEIADRLAYVAQQIDVLPDIAPARVEAPHVDSRPASSESRDAPESVRPRTSTHDAAYLRAAREHFNERPWTLKQLATTLEVGSTSAGLLRDAWLMSGACHQVNLGRWSFDITESRD